MLVRSSTVTRRSSRSRGWSWPWPTSRATTSRAPRARRASVKPPVDAPTSSTRSPRTSIPNRSRAASSFSPPRPTNRGGGPETVTASPAATSRAGFSATAPFTSTRMAATACWASARLGTSPRRTSSASRRRRAGTQAGGDAAFFLVVAFFAGAFFAGAFFAGAFLAVAFFAGAFFAVAFLAGAFLAVAFLAVAFFAGAFLAGPSSPAPRRRRVGSPGRPGPPPGPRPHRPGQPGGRTAWPLPSARARRARRRSLGPDRATAGRPPRPPTAEPHPP